MEKKFEALDCLNKIQHNFGQLKGQELVNCFETIFKDLTELKQIKKAKPSEALEILETLADDGLLNKEIGMISYNQIWLKMKIEVLKQALLKARVLEKENAELKKSLNIKD